MHDAKLRVEDKGELQGAKPPQLPQIALPDGLKMRQPLYCSMCFYISGIGK